MSFDLSLNASQLILTFDEAINALSLDVTLVSIYPDMLGTVPHPLTGTDRINTSSDPTTLFIDLTREDSNTLKIESNFATSMGDTYIHREAHFISDLAGNSFPSQRTSQVSTFTPDTSPPELHSFTINMDTGIITLRKYPND